MWSGEKQKKKWYYSTNLIFYKKIELKISVKIYMAWRLNFSFKFQ